MRLTLQWIGWRSAERYAKAMWIACQSWVVRELSWNSIKCALPSKSTTEEHTMQLETRGSKPLRNEKAMDCAAQD